MTKGPAIKQQIQLQLKSKKRIKLDRLVRKPAGDPARYSQDVQLQELTRVSEYTFASLLYFIVNYCQIESNDQGGWIPFDLWDTDCAPYDNQVDAVQKIFENKRVVVLKSRQVGLTWVMLAIALWHVLFFPPYPVLLLSRGDMEAKELLERLKGMYKALPTWMKAEETPTDNKQKFVLSNGSSFRSVSTRGGDSMTFKMVIVDEADLIYRANTTLSQVILNVGPTVGVNGRMILISKSDKNRPNSTFKNIYRSAEDGTNRYASVFVPWHVNPDRTDDWYKGEREVSLSIDGTLDHLWESYPETPEQAMAPKSASKRLPVSLVSTCYERTQPIGFIDSRLKSPGEWYKGFIAPNVKIYETPEPNVDYVIGADPAEGLATSDPSALVVTRVDNLAEVFTFSGKATPELLAAYTVKISRYYNNAPVLYERNNHGILYDREMRGTGVKILKGWTIQKTKKNGWYTSEGAKILMYDTVAKILRSQDALVRDANTFAQLCSIESSTLRAPQGEHDDLAIAYCLCIVAVEICGAESFRLDIIRLPA